MLSLVLRLCPKCSFRFDFSAVNWSEFPATEGLNKNDSFPKNAGPKEQMKPAEGTQGCSPFSSR